MASPQKFVKKGFLVFLRSDPLLPTDFNFLISRRTKMARYLKVHTASAFYLAFLNFYGHGSIRERD